MRIRKRQAVVLEPPRATHVLSTVNSGNENEHVVGQNSCTCCSWQRRLPNWEFRNDFDRETDEPVNKVASEISLIDKSQIADGEENESIVAATLGSLGSYGRVRSNELNNNKTTAGSQVPGLYVTGQFHDSGDRNHPRNKPKESLLYSLYCVFSKLSGKAVLTAREALSRIIEERLPGLDEQTGMPSLQVSKVMRSNPYFVHVEDGKFFLCSAPSLEIKEDAELEDIVDSEYTPRSASAATGLQPTTLGLLNSLNKAESSRDKNQQPSSNHNNTEVHQRTGSARSKAVATINSNVAAANGVLDKSSNGSGRSRGLSRRGGGKKALNAQQNSISDQGHDAEQPLEPICKRYDGRGWKCKEKALPGYSMCRHHHELIVNRLARLQSSGRLVSKKSSKGRKRGRKASTAKPSKGVATASINEGDVSVNHEQSGTHLWKNVKARSLKSINN